MKHSWLFLIASALLVGCSPPPSLLINSDPSHLKNRVVTKSESCDFCKTESWPKGVRAVQSSSPPFTPSFTIAQLQAYFASHPISGTTITYGTTGFTAVNSSQTVGFSLDEFGFLGTITKGGTDFVMTYDNYGLVDSVDKRINGVTNPWLGFVYNAPRTAVLGYHNYETGDYTTLAQNDSGRRQHFAVGGLSGSTSSSLQMQMTQSISQCEACYENYRTAMGSASNQCGICTSAALAGFVICELGSAGVGSPICFPGWVVANAVCIGYYIDLRRVAEANLQTCLNVNGCSPQPELRFPPPHSGQRPPRP